MKSTKQRQTEYRARMRDKGLKEIRGVYAKPKDHKKVKEWVKIIFDTRGN